MPDIDLIDQLGKLLGRPLQEVSEHRFEQHIQAKYTQVDAQQQQITKDAYSLAADGTVSGLLLQPVTSQRLIDFPLSQLRQLKYLHLANVKLGSYAFLSELTELKTLYLSGNSSTDCSFLRQLTGLTALYLSSNRSNNCSFLRQLTGLTSLYLSGNRIIDCRFLRQLTGLKILELSSNRITDCSPLSQLIGLTSLNLSDNSITDLSFLRQLTGLTSLDLSCNNITDCSFLRQLTELTSLNLSNNDITDCSFLRQLTGLTSLDLSNNDITDCSFLNQLTGLTSLSLSENDITDFSSLSQLTGLTSLNLSYNSITNCSFLSQLTGLTSLSLSENKITDCSFLRQLTGLTSLDLSYNSITNCSFLSQLTELTSLNLSDNKITDCLFLRQLTGLISLNLSDNSITKVPMWLAKGRQAVIAYEEHIFVCINLYNNPITEPPIEIFRQGNTAILNYYAQLDAQGQDQLYEAKMLIVGGGEAGKTTLAHKIAEPNCPLPHIEDRTRGISIQTHTFTCRNRTRSATTPSQLFHLNIWDFGGQEIYHSTHRFFLSKRSLYVLVADNRKNDTDFSYWLNIIEQFAGNSPLIIVLNEKDDIQCDHNRAELRSRYPNSIKEIIPINFKTHEEADTTKATPRLNAIYSLIDQIELCAQNLPHIGEVVPARWVDVRRAIESDTRNHIYREQFDELCKDKSITDTQDIDTLLSYFHDLGILLHFEDNALLRNRVILKPAWATNAIYRIFDDTHIKTKAGRFTRQDCANIWTDRSYSRMHDVLIELMKNFRLLYEVDTTGDLVAPQLLPKSTPTYDWDTDNNSHMQLRYDAFMPKGIFWQFAVTMYRYIHNHDWIWRSGMVIKRGDTWAEIKEDLNLRRISLSFSGPNIREFRAVIIDELDRISSAYHQLQYDKMIPCQCSECTDSPAPHFFNYTVLKKRQESGRKSTIECQHSAEDVSLTLLLEGFNVREIVETLPEKKGQEPAPPEVAKPHKKNNQNLPSIFLRAKRR